MKDILFFKLILVRKEISSPQDLQFPVGQNRILLPNGGVQVGYSQPVPLSGKNVIRYCSYHLKQADRSLLQKNLLNSYGILREG